MATAHAVATRSLCARDSVGAVIVNAKNRIVSTGYNGPPEGFQHNELPCTVWCPRAVKQESQLDPGYNDCFSLHAEANALLVCDRRDREGGIIYVSSPPCFNCAKLVANSGLSTVVYKRSVMRGYRNIERTCRFLEQCGLTVIEYGS